MTTKLHQVPEHLFAYCERAGDPAIWGEPLNAVTNLAFIYVGYLAFRLLRDLSGQNKRYIDIWILTLSLFAIGVGSGLWHTYAAAQWTVIADVIPIYIFINTYIFALFIRLFGFGWVKTGIIWLIFTAINITVQNTLPPETLNGSLMYLPTLGLMLFASSWLYLRQHDGAIELSSITGLFLISLAFRTMDFYVCDTIPIGTHFLWHIINALVLYRLVGLLLPKTDQAT